MGNLKRRKTGGVRHPKRKIFIESDICISNNPCGISPYGEIDGVLFKYYFLNIKSNGKIYIYMKEGFDDFFIFYFQAIRKINLS